MKSEVILCSEDKAFVLGFVLILFLLGESLVVFFF